MYSGPPEGQTPPAEQTLHIIVDTAPQKVAPRDEIADAQPERPAHAIPDAKPGVPTTLVFRDGHKQEVTNYAIMGQTLYVFDSRTRKIALADIDVPATVKANDDQGVEFQVPKAKQSSKPVKPGVPLQSAPEQSPKTSSSTTTP
jgi:endonuclease YncB( thermonuclease family)